MGAVVHAERNVVADLVKLLGADFDRVVLKSTDGREIIFEKSSKFKSFMEMLAK